MQYVGSEIDLYCNGSPECVNHNNETIYMIEKDWWLLAHAQCHVLSKVRHKPRKKLKLKPISMDALDQ